MKQYIPAGKLRFVHELRMNLGPFLLHDWRRGLIAKADLGKHVQSKLKEVLMRLDFPTMAPWAEGHSLQVLPTSN
jgi:hypothetical protein